MRRKWLWIVLGLAVLGAGGYGAWRLSQTNPLPERNTIEAVVARFYFGDKERDVTVVVPAERFDQLWSAFQPAAKADEPGDWPIWADLQLATKDHRVWTITVFDPGDGSQAFEISDGAEVKFYRGGHKRGLEELLIEEAKKDDKLHKH